MDVISIIVPVYNVEKYLKRCVDSLINQTFPALEIILVDDGSTDGSNKICKEYVAKNSNVILVEKSNGGLSSARNAGLLKATGQYIGFVDSDDWVLNDTYEYLYRLIRKYEADISDISCQYVYEDTFDVIQPVEKISIYEGETALKEYLYRGLSEYKGAPYTVWRKLYKKTLFDYSVLFEEGTLNEDICFNYQMIQKASRIVISNQIKYMYFQNSNSLTSGKLKKKDFDLITVCDQLVELSQGSNNGEIIKLAKMKRARSDFSLLSKLALAGASEELEEQTISKKLSSDLRKNINLLLRSPMPLNRKVIAVSFCFSYRFTKSILCILRGK